MNEKKSVRLYQCHRCARQTFQDGIDKGLSCSCGSRQVGNAPATFKYIFGYFFHSPSEILTYVKENIFGEDNLWALKK